MMAQKHLHELLEEDQEPFLLRNYIADRRSQLKKPVPRTSPQVTNRKPIVKSSVPKHSLCQKACFFSFHDSPDHRKSPLSADFPSPMASKAKSSSKNSNAVFLHIPARTGALLQEAAIRIQKQSASPKPKTQVKNGGIGLFGSILKRLGNRHREQNSEMGCDLEGLFARKSAGKSEKLLQNVAVAGEKFASGSGFSRSCDNSQRNSTVWSESNEEKSLDLETCSSSMSRESEEDIPAAEGDTEAFSFREKRFCSSPQSPFRFALQKSASSGLRTPDFSSPAASPISRTKEEKERCEVESIQQVKLEDEEEEKEQCSPVSVLEPPFKDDDEMHEDRDMEDGYDIDCSYAIVQRVKQQLLQKLRRFERLAQLDPLELERTLFEENEDEDRDDDETPDEEDVSEQDGYFLKEVMGKLDLHLGKAPGDIKRLVLDLIAEEDREDEEGTERELVMERVCRRLEAWKEVQSNTIDMMVDLDFRRKLDGWKRYDEEQVKEAAMEIELAIFGELVEELSEGLVFLNGGLQREVP